MQPKILYVADSVGHTASILNVELNSKSRVVTAKAYSSVYDVNARWPKQNFSEVVKNNLENQGRDNYDVLVMSAPTVDISNLDTSKLTSNDSTKIYKQKVIESSHNMFRVAEESLKMNPGLSKVVIMEHPPRFDDKLVDPTLLKPTLAKLANSTLGKLWQNCSLKDKIVIGRHSLENSGAVEEHSARYEDQRTGRYDGVHLYGYKGRKDYTNSVKTIFMVALSDNGVGTAQAGNHENCPQTKYKKNKHQPTVNTKNRFSVFNSNQGN